MTTGGRHLLLAALAVAASFPSPAAEGSGATAKAALPQVTAAARKWQPDALLVSLSTLLARADGTAPEWKYAFYSPKVQKRFVVTAHGSRVEGREVRLGFGTEPLGEFIDSDAAMREARKGGLKGNEPSMSVNLRGAGKAASTYWVVNGGFAKGDVSVFLEAATGRFSSRSTME